MFMFTGASDIVIQVFKRLLVQLLPSLFDLLDTDCCSRGLHLLNSFQWLVTFAISGNYFLLLLLAYSRETRSCFARGIGVFAN